MKRARLLEILSDRDAGSLLLTSAASVNWYLDGARTHVSLAAEPIVAVEVTPEGDTVRLTDNEESRLIREELPEGVAVHRRAWLESPPPSDGLVEADVDAALRAARRELLPTELRRYEALGTSVAATLTDVLGAAEPDWTERELAARLAHDLIASGSEPLVVLVAGDARRAFRHPLPTAGRLGRRAMAVVCARRAGLIANVTRWVSFGPLDARDADAEDRILAVEADVFDGTVPGASTGDLIAVVAGAYPRHGFAADEWRRHHQGGPAGYAGRDPRATPGGLDRFADGQAFTWNPSGDGAKVEDTVLLTGSGVRALTFDPRWPVRVVGGRARPVTLVR